MTSVLKSILQKVTGRVLPSSSTDSIDYTERLQNEQAFYKDCLDVHKLPEIFHYWSNKFLAPDLHRFGFTDPDDFFAFYLAKFLVAPNHQQTCILSVGSGNCDVELAIAGKLVEQGYSDFVFECLDINEDMLERGRRAADKAGMASNFIFTRGDFNNWSPVRKYGIVMANQSLHHVLNLEGLFDAVKASLEPDGLFLVSDMIGRNGHMRWPEALERLRPFWNELPEAYRHNQLLNRYEEQYIDHDCSIEGFEGIRAQDILPLLLEKFNFNFFFPFGNMVFVFVDRPFGQHFDVSSEWDREFIDRVHASDEAGFLSGALKPTSMLAVLTAQKTDTLLRRSALTPEYCVRDPREAELMEDLVNKTVRNSRNELHKRFVSAQPFRHIEIDDFLTPEFAHSLLDSFPAFDEKFAINENGEVGGKAMHEQITGLGRDWHQLDQLVKGDEFRLMISEITGIPELKFDPHYFGGGTHENLHGQGLNPHVDFNFHPITSQHRRMNLILYLSPEWQPEWGGSIQLHRDPYKPPAEDDIVTITPVFNRCVIFETNEYSWHGLRPINLPEHKRNLSRKSFALYYYTDTRPAEELGAEHSTIYVEEHLPEDFHAGMELSAGQLQHTKNLLNSRDQHLKRLYADIKQLHFELSYLRGDNPVIGQNSNFSINEGDSPEVLILKNQIFGLQRRIQEFESSTSWRVTKPLRALKSRFSQRS